MNVVLLLIASITSAPGVIDEYRTGGYDQQAKIWESGSAERFAETIADFVTGKGFAIDKIVVESPKGTNKVVFTKGGKNTLATLEPNALLALYLFISTKKAPGVEEDFVVSIAEPHTMVGATWGHDKTIHVQTAPVPESPKPSAKAKKVTKKYKLGGFVDGDKPWTEPDVAMVESALKLIGPKEVPLLAGLEFKRFTKNPQSGSPGEAGGKYVNDFMDARKSRVELYDAIHSSQSSFRGDPWKPNDANVCMVVHEFGHAIAAAGERLPELKRLKSNKKSELEKLSIKIDKSQADAEKKKAKYQAAHKKIGGSSKPKDKKKLDKLFNAANKAQLDTNAMRDDYNKKQKVWKQEASRRKALRKAVGEMLEVLPRAKAVTQYGRTKDSEAFAEAFMLFRCDPGALQRLSPKLFKWFESGRHIKIVRDEMKK